MDVPVSVFRAHLSEWIDRARQGEQVVLTERGVPVARLGPLNEEDDLLARLEREGVIGPRPVAPRARAMGVKRERISVSLSDIVSEQRDER